MGLWTDRLLPRLTDRTLDNPVVDALRARACRGLRGQVLEIGFGSGLNLPHLSPEVTAVDAVEPADLAWRRSAARRTRATVPVRRTGLDGQRLAAADASYDAVLSTFTLCTIPDPLAALGEVRRVLRPGGRLHVLEHGAAPDPAVRRWQHRLDPLQRRVAGGCHLSRDVRALLATAGFDAVGLAEEAMPGPKALRPWGHLYLGVVGIP